MTDGLPGGAIIVNAEVMGVFGLSWSTVENLNWLTAIAYEALHKIVPEKELELWTQTCRL